MKNRPTYHAALTVPVPLVESIARIALGQARREGAPVTAAPGAAVAWLEVAREILTGPDARTLDESVEVWLTVAEWVWAATWLRRTGHPDGEALYLRVLEAAATFAAA